jgi:hypothetical protein
MKTTTTIQVTTTKTEATEVTLPYYSKSISGMFYSKITQDGKTVKCIPDNFEIKVLEFESNCEIEITAEEFNAKFNEVLHNIQNFNK